MFNQLFTKVERAASVAILVGLFEASCLIKVPKVHGPLTFPTWLQEFHVRDGSSTTFRLVISRLFCRIESSVVGLVLVAVVALVTIVPGVAFVAVVVVVLERSVERAFVKPEIETA